MAIFFVGQRVRIIRCVTKPEYVGRETVITAPLDTYWSKTFNRQYEAYRVAIDDKFGPAPDALEPATDANDKIEWSECLWCPEHLRETV